MTAGSPAGTPKVWVLDVPPSANVYWRVWRNRAVRSVEAEAYRAKVFVQLRNQRAKKLTGPVVVYAWWYRAIKSGDLDNRLKVLLDALQGHAYASDAQVVELHAYRREDPVRPRMEVSVMPWENAA